MRFRGANLGSVLGTAAGLAGGVASDAAGNPLLAKVLYGLAGVLFVLSIILTLQRREEAPSRVDVTAMDKGRNIFAQNYYDFSVDRGGMEIPPKGKTPIESTTTEGVYEFGYLVPRDSQRIIFRFERKTYALPIETVRCRVKDLTGQWSESHDLASSKVGEPSYLNYPDSFDGAPQSLPLPAGSYEAVWIRASDRTTITSFMVDYAPRELKRPESPLPSPLPHGWQARASHVEASAHVTLSLNWNIAGALSLVRCSLQDPEYIVSGKAEPIGSDQLGVAVRYPFSPRTPLKEGPYTVLWLGSQDDKGETVRLNHVLSTYGFDWPARKS